MMRSSSTLLHGIQELAYLFYTTRSYYSGSFLERLRYASCCERAGEDTLVGNT